MEWFINAFVVRPVQIIAPIWIVVFALLPIVDWIAPWEAAVRELDKHERSHLRICIGLNSGQRSFLIFPDSLISTRCYTVQEEDGRYIYSELPGMVIVWVLLYAMMVRIAIRFSIPNWRAFLNQMSS